MPRSMLYGSGKTAEANAEIKGNEQPAPEMNPLMVLNEILMAPINLAAMMVGSANPEEIQTRYVRAFVPQGGVKPTMSTKTMKQKNIFGAGGGY